MNNQNENIRMRSGIFTINNPTQTKEELEAQLNKLNPECYAFQKEKGAEGTPHWQGYIMFKNAKWTNAIKKKVHKIWIQKADNNQAAWKYATKEDSTYIGDRTTFGPPPRNTKNKGGTCKERLQYIREQGLEAALNEGHIKLEAVPQVKKALQILDTDMAKPDDRSGVCGIWLQGPPNAGKSYAARTMAVKLSGKEPYTVTNQHGEFQFEGYKGEPVIHIEDLDHIGGKNLGHKIKLWADKYACMANSKGASIWLRHKVIIVSSNYSI